MSPKYSKWISVRGWKFWNWLIWKIREEWLNC